MKFTKTALSLLLFSTSALQFVSAYGVPDKAVLWTKDMNINRAVQQLQELVFAGNLARGK